MDEPVAVRTTIHGPAGAICIAATDRGIVAVGWLTTDEAFDAGLARRLGGRVAPAGSPAGSSAAPGDRERHLADGVAWVEAFLAGRPSRPPPPVDLADRPAWDRRVLGAVAAIPWGRTASYGDIARRIGAPRASQAVGGALGRNPLLFLIPCHRVIAADGTLGGWGGDRWADHARRLRDKQRLLLREGVTAEPRAV